MPDALEVYCVSLKQPDYARLRELSALYHGAVDMARVNAAIQAGVEKRLLFAGSLLRLAVNLLASAAGLTDEEQDVLLRCALSRAYYPVHHSLRALLLFENNGDVDGHREAIKAVTNLSKKSGAVRSKLGRHEDLQRDLKELLDRRHLADYYPYGTNNPNEAPVDMGEATEAAVALAQRILAKTQEYIQDKRAGIL